MTRVPTYSGYSGKRSRTMLRVFAIAQIALLVYASGAQFVFAQAEGPESFENIKNPEYSRGTQDLRYARGAEGTVDAAPGIPYAVPTPEGTSDPAITAPAASEPAPFPAFGTDESPIPDTEFTAQKNEEATESSLPSDKDENSSTPPSEEPPKEEPPVGLGPMPEPPYSSVQPVPASYRIKPDVDQSTGALTYRYPLTLPPGRNGMTPELSLAYNSQDRREGSPVGFGWSISLPAIERQNLTGIRNFFTDERFTSSLSGELVRITAGETPNNFAARVDDGSFIRYTFAGNAWTAKTKDGTTYTFGSTDASRLFDANGDPNKIARWLLDRIEDTNGNRINFTYVRDLNQLYLDTASYTDTTLGAGPFLVTFVRELRPEADRSLSYANGFRTETRYRVSEIQTRVSGALTNRYALGYTQSPANNRSLLARITQTGYDAGGAMTVLPPTSFAYTPDSMNFTDSGPNPFGTVAPLADSSLRFGYLIADINGDGYADLVRSHEKNVANPPIHTTDRRVWLNDHNGSLIESTTWTGTSTLPFICVEDDSFNCRGQGSTVFDQNGDSFADYYWSDGGGSRLGMNTGSGWQETPIGAGYSLIPTYSYRPIMASYGGANPPHAIEISDSNGVSGYFGTMSNLGNRVADVNHDGLPDAVRSAGSLSETNGLDEAVYLNNGTDPVTGIVHFEQIGWQFLNGTNIGANAPAANAIFERRGASGAFLADMNGDDLPDTVTADNSIYRHTGNTWAFSNTIPLTGYYQETQLADMNGDGMLDMVVSDMCGYRPGACRTRVLYHTGDVPDLLQTITLPAGGTISAAYKASPSYKDASGALLNPTLPIAIQTVERITETDPVTGISGATSYEYAGGKYFFQNLTNRRFAGFAQVTATKPDGSKTSAYFNVVDERKLGKPSRTDLIDAAGNSIKRTLTSWTTTSLPSLGASRFLTVPDTTVAMDLGAGGAYRAQAQTFAYTVATGALLSKTEYGEVTVADPFAPVFTDIGNDARTTTYTYAINGNGLELPATQTLTDYANATIGRTRTYYDTLPLGEVSLGNRTKVEQLIDTIANTYATTQWSYTPTGLVETETDPLGHATQFTYDTLGLYPETVTNALNQQTTYAYDYTNGKPVTTTDPNGEVRRTIYDGLDRVVEEWKPHPVTGTLILAHTIRYTDQAGQAAVHEQSMSGGSSNTHAIDLEKSSSQYLSAANSASLSITGDMTIEAWVKLESQPASGQDFTFAAKFGTAGGRSYFFDYDNTTGTPRFGFAPSANGISGPAAWATYTLTSGTWYHVAVVYTAASGSAEFFVDGASIGNGSGLHTSIFNSSSDFTIGARSDGPSTAGFLDGLIDEVRVWASTRTRMQILMNKNAEISGSQAGLNAYWKLNNALDDLTVNRNSLANPANAPFVTDVPFGAGTGPVLVTQDSYLYLDGFGRPIQKRERAEGTGVGGLPAYTATDTNYNNQGRVESVSLPYTSSGSARIPRTTNPSLITSYRYDAAGKVVSVTDAIGTTAAVYDRWDTAITDPNNHQKRFARDAFGRLVRVEEFPAGVPPAAVTSYAYDTLGNLTNMTDAEGNVRNFTYDALGRRLTAEDLHAPSDTTFGVYSFTYDAAGNLTQKQTPKAETIIYIYDALNRELTEDFLGVAGTEVTYAYDTCTRGIGRRCGETTAGASRTLTYDFAGNAATETVTVNSAPYTTSYVYDQLGNVTRTTHPDGSVTLSTLNESGRTETVSWQANATSPAAPLVTNIDYAPHGAVAKIERGNNLEETFLYDTAAKYRLLEHIVGPTGSGAPPVISNTHAIDLEDSSSQYLSAVDSASLSITGDMTIEMWVKLESQPVNGHSFTLASKFLPPANISFVWDYEDNGGTPRLRFITSANGRSSPASMFALNYTLATDAWYHVAVVYTAASGSAEFFVDGTSIGGGSGLATSIFGSREPFFIGTRTDPGPTPTAFFDGMIDDVRVWASTRTRMQILENKDRELTWIEPDLRAYWKLNNALTDATTNNNTLSNHANVPFVTDVPFGGGSPPAPPSALARYQYTYDPVGNVLSIIEVQDACPATQPCGATTTSNYLYDPLDRLTQATVAIQTEQGTSQTVSDYAYGATGNLLLSPAGKYAYTDTNTAVSSFSNPHAAVKVGNRSLAYDKNGNLTSDTGGTANIANSWNYKNELTYTALKITGVKKSVAYAYDSAGMRVSLRENTAGGATLTNFPTPSYSETVNPDSSVERTVSIEAAGMPIATIRTVGTSTPEVFATHTDHLRSTRFVTSESVGLGTVNVVESTDYDAFGKIISHIQSPTSNFIERKKFTSHEFDQASGYTYAKARYLDTEVGRFVSEDQAFIYSPEKFLNDPQQQNSYGYARNNPVKFVDPNGESATLIGAVAGGVAGGVIGAWQGGNWQSAVTGFAIGAATGAAVGSVIDTGGLSAPLFGKIFLAYSVADLGIDIYDLKTKTYDYPDQFTQQEKTNAYVTVGFDALTLGLGQLNVLNQAQTLILDTLTASMDVLDQYLGKEIYKNVNEKYRNSVNLQQGSPLSSSPLSASGATVNINYSPSFADIRQQLNQISSLLEQIRNSINNQQR